ncbi:TonB C-terminal domain-containing protein [SAR86 cluster bacterium]|nr:TonB C-terminal domain-containing protein [SAR86 cluster bacterium]
MTNFSIGFISSLVIHILLFLFLTLDFSLKNTKENFSSIPIKFISLSKEIKEIVAMPQKKSIKKLESNAQSLIEVIKTKDEPILDIFAQENLKTELNNFNLAKENMEVQLRINLIQKRINSVWKKPSMINQDIQVEITINLAPSGEILSFALLNSSKNKVFDDSALAAISNISFLPEVINLDRSYFEKNFRSFNLVFKSIGN